MTSSNEQLVPVEQIDREAAIVVMPGNTAMELGRLAKVRNGEHDDHPTVQAFARHRLAALRTPPAVEPDEGLVEKVAKAIHEVHMRERGPLGAWPWAEASKSFYNALAEAAVTIATPSIRAQALEGAAQDWELPEDIASAIRSIGKAEWGATARKRAEDHAADVANSVRLTAEHFGQTEPQPMHGLYVEGTETVICHTGTSPNSAVHAQALTGAWNWLHDHALKGGQGV